LINIGAMFYFALCLTTVLIHSSVLILPSIIFCRTSWIIDSQRFAKKIKSTSGSLDPSKQKWISNPSMECKNCGHVIDNSDVSVVHFYYFELGLLQFFHYLYSLHLTVAIHIFPLNTVLSVKRRYKSFGIVVSLLSSFLVQKNYYPVPAL
jgi:hypothetical protein